MRFSLSAKLALLLLLSLGCVLVPVLAVTYVSTGENVLRADQEKFMTTLRVMEENIDAGFLRLNAAKLEGVIRAKERLRGTARRFALLPAPDRTADGPAAQEAAPALEELRRNFIRESEKEGLLLDSFPPASLAQGPQTRLGLRPEMTDIKGRDLREVLAHLPAAGDFGIYRPPGYGPLLVYFLPAPDRTRERVTICAISIQSLEDEAEATVHALTRELEARFHSLSLYSGGFIALLDASGAILAAKGAFGPSERSSLAPLFEQARASGATARENALRIRRSDGEEEDYLAAVAFSRPFGWFTVMAAPLAEIDAPSRALLGRLAAQSLGIGLTALLVSLFLLRRAIRPLRLLLPKLTALPDMDFSSPQAGAALAYDLPLDRRDEAGDLARSFSAMGERLQANVRALMESSAMQERLRGELGAAREIQHGILPPPDLAPNIFGIASSAMLEPAREVGGDLYYFFTLPDGRHAFVIGDVSGKGVPAALFMAITVTLTRYTLAAESDPGAALSQINALLEAHNPRTMFVTLFLALYDPVSGRLEYANGGHNPPLLVGGGSVTRLNGLSGPLVGVMPGVQYQSFSHALREGDLCLLYTDGVTEAVNEAGEAYDEKRLEAYLAAHGAEHPKDLLTGIFADVRHFRGTAAPFDDITMLAFARR
jgi:sigma-B regulation protein RsbU (phosphoserine phosphatase)